MEQFFDTSTWIALGAMVVAILSALYSRRAVEEARKANRISMHQYQRSLHLEFRALHEYMQEAQHSASMAEVKKFSPHRLMASTYFPKALAMDVEAFYQVCLEVVTLQQRVCNRLTTLEYENHGGTIGGAGILGYPDEQESEGSLRSQLNTAVEHVTSHGPQIDQRLLHAMDLS